MYAYFNKTLFVCYGTDSPPSVNTLYRSAGGRLYKPVPVVRWEELLGWQVRQLSDDLPLFKEAPLYALFCWFNDRADIDNRLKTALDAMNSSVYRDDSDIKALISVKLNGEKGFFYCVSSNPFATSISTVMKAKSCEEIKEMIEKGEL